MLFAHHFDIFYVCVEMGNDECTEMQLKFEYSLISSLFVTTPKLGATDPNPTAADHEVSTQMFWALNQLCQAFPQDVQLG